MAPSDGDIVVTWVTATDEGQLRLRLCQQHLDEILKRISAWLLAGGR